MQEFIFHVLEGMTGSLLLMLMEECLHLISGEKECGENHIKLKRAVQLGNPKTVETKPQLPVRRGRVKGTVEGLLDSIYALNNGTITAIIDSLFKSSHEIFHPLPSGGADNDKDLGSHQSIQKARYTHPFSCSMCDSVLCEPVTLPCGHTYCKKCLVKWKPNVCKVCKRKLYTFESNETKGNVLVANLVKKWWTPELNAAAIREKGNHCVSEQEYAKALGYYSDALQLAPHDHITLGNRSLVLNKLARSSEALRDADTAIKHQPFWAKGHFRQAAALKSLGRMEDALVAYILCAVLEENASAVRGELEKLLRRILRHRRVSADGHVNKQRRRNESETDDQLLPDDSPPPPPASVFSAPDVCACGREERTSTGADSPLLRIFSRCHAAVQSLKDRDGEQYVRTVEDPDTVKREDFECSLCYRLLWQPTATPCGHTFCRPCIDRWLDHSPTCPLCKTTLEEFLAERDRSTTVFLQLALETLLPAELAERRRMHEEEVLVHSLADHNHQHEIPIFVCTIAFPSLPCPLHVFEPRYRLMIRRCMESGTREFGMCQASATDPHGFADHGVMLEIRDLQYFPDGRSVVDAIGSRRFRCLEKGERDGYYTARVEFLADQPVPEEGVQELQRLHDEVRALVETWWSSGSRSRAEFRARVVSFFGQLPSVETNYWRLPSGPSWLWWTLAILPLPPSAQLGILMITSLKRRLHLIGNAVRRLPVAS